MPHTGPLAVVTCVPLVHGGAAAAANNEPELETAATALEAIPAPSTTAAATPANKLFDAALRLMSHSPPCRSADSCAESSRREGCARAAAASSAGRRPVTRVTGGTWRGNVGAGGGCRTIMADAFSVCPAV